MRDTQPPGSGTSRLFTPNRARAISACKYMLKAYKMIKNKHGVYDSKQDPDLSGIVDLLCFDDTEVEVRDP